MKNYEKLWVWYILLVALFFATPVLVESTGLDDPMPVNPRVITSDEEGLAAVVCKTNTDDGLYYPRMDADFVIQIWCRNHKILIMQKLTREEWNRIPVLPEAHVYKGDLK